MSRSLEPSAKRLAHFNKLLAFDKDFKGFGTSLAGMDEAGRGSLLGPVVAACVILPEAPLISWVDDSKKLSPARRETLFDQIMNLALYVGVGQATAKEIDRLNILIATKLAMRRAGIEAPATQCLVDAVMGIELPFPTHAVVHGDALSYHIAAASIIAKVTRDRTLIEMDRQYPAYGLANNQGYGTAAHIDTIRQQGPTAEHRLSFISKFLPGTEGM